jgi:hypothetical protein
MTAANSSPPIGRIIATLACLAALPLCLSIAGNLFAGFPSYSEWACGDSSASGCVEWSLVTVGPLYILYVVFFGLIVGGLAAAPVLLLPIIWLVGRKKTAKLSNTGETTSQVATAELDSPDVAQVERKYHNLKVVDSSTKAKRVASRVAVQEHETLDHLANETETVSIKSAVKEIFSRADRNA